MTTTTTHHHTESEAVRRFRAEVELDRLISMAKANQRTTTGVPQPSTCDCRMNDCAYCIKVPGPLRHGVNYADPRAFVRGE